MTILRSWLRDWTPPVLVRFLRRILGRRDGPPEWEYVGMTWPGEDSRATGWDDRSVVETQRRQLEGFRRRLDGTSPLVTWHEGAGASSQDHRTHNTYMTFAYVLARAAAGRNTISVLDWGGGLGQYYLIARAVLPEMSIDYHCVDLPLACSAGRQLIPEVSFHEPEGPALHREFDLVVSSSSLQYAQDWSGQARALAGAAGRFLFITRLPMAMRNGPFVVVQRPHVHGYDTEYLGWVIDRDELIEQIEASGLVLDREFLVDERPHVIGAPEQPRYRGFLFKRRVPSG